MSRFCDTLIIGAGASGLMCAAHLKRDFLILEGSDRPAKKLVVSGGGRCNFTNEIISSDNYTGDKAFITTVISKFSFQDMLLLSKQWKIDFELCKNRQLFCKNSSKEIIAPLLVNSKGRVVLNTKVLSVSFDKNVFTIQTTNGAFGANNIIVASGGISYPVLGASDIGYSIAKSFGHTIVAPRPALVGFTVQPSEFWFKELSGISVSAIVKVGAKSFEDAILFAYKGISGPAILNASLYWEKGLLSIDFLPGMDIEKLFSGTTKQITTVLGLPKRAIKAFLNSVGMEDKRVDKLTKEDKDKLLRLKNYEFAPAGTFGLTKAEITKGGVSTVEVGSDTMESKLQKGLYFVGEVLDVNGELGGYNFHWAFASAIACARGLERNGK
jgi:predicted Rossmann fold flavoprotein